MAHPLRLACFLFLLAVPAPSLADVDDLCDKVEARIPESFVASIRISMDDKLSNRTLLIEEALDGRMKRSIVQSLESGPSPTDPEKQDRISKMAIIYNKENAGVEKFLSIYTEGWPETTSTVCMADTLDEDSFINVLFGFSQSGDANPTVTGMLHFNIDQLKCTSAEGSMMKAFQVVEFQGTVVNTDTNEKLTVKYYWTVANGVSIPVAVEVAGKFNVGGTTSTEVTLFVEYDSFMNVVPDAELFLPPRDVYCLDRKRTVKLKESVPNFFSFQSEIVFFHEDQLTVLPRTEWYDYDMAASRIDYNLMQPGQNKYGRAVTEIQDFWTGISYQIVKDAGICQVETTQNIFGEAILVVHPDGSVHMPSPFDYWHFHDTFAPNGMHNERGLDVQFFETRLVVPYGGSNISYTYVIGLAGSNIQEDGSGYTPIGYGAPVTVYMYPTLMYNQPQNRTRMNIANFAMDNKGLDFQYVFDITPCFGNTQMYHFRMRFPLTAEMDLSNEKFILDESRGAITVAAQVTPIRAQNVILDFDGVSYLYVICTLVDFPSHVVSPDNLNEDATRSLADAVSKLQKAIKDGKVTMEFKNKSPHGGKPLTSIADKNVFDRIDRTDNGGSGPGPQTAEGYSPGAMAGLGIAMLLIAACATLGVLVFVLKW